MPLSPKLCFAGVELVRTLLPRAALGKQSFQDKCVTKLELGHGEPLCALRLSVSALQ